MEAKVQKTSIQEKRERLKTLSEKVKSLVKAGDYENINQAIIKTIYSPNNSQEFKTFNQWKEAGRTVKKGEKAFVVWGKPRKNKEKEELIEGEEQYKLYPLCFLFSEAQTEEMKEVENEN